MDTKLKSKWLLLAWLLLFAYGLNGTMTGLVHAGDYLQRDYFQSAAFERELIKFLDMLSAYELNYIPKEEAKRSIVATQEEIEEHRYRYGELSEQIASIQRQYAPRIQQALAENNRQAADAYIAERDKKIEDITLNFQSDEHVRVKIVKEKEQLIDDYYRELESRRAEFVKNKGNFRYYLKDVESGKVYTNVSPDQASSGKTGIDPKEMAYILNKSSLSFDSQTSGPFTGSLEFAARYPEIYWKTLTLRKPAVFAGQIAVPKSAVAVGAFADYQDFQQRQLLFYAYAGSGIAALLTSLFLLKKIPVIRMIAPEHWQPAYNRIPLDLKGAILFISAMVALVWLESQSIIHYPPYSVYRLVSETLFDTGFTAFLSAFILLQARYLWANLREANLGTEWRNTLLCRVVLAIREAFLLRQSGTKVFLLLAVAFAAGFGAFGGLMEPSLLPVYLFALILAGVPALVFIVKSTGYFNQIVLHTRELASGRPVSRLPVKGKSALASLAENINRLQDGVNASQREQAKSERLKTELITNVSHDLRTPLTSIITYTELLKSPQLSEDERQSYIEIIDRKSKRLKSLIDDLFEASKMATGNVDMVKERVDLVQLLQQALAEYSDQISESSLQFRVTTPKEPVYAFVDGQKIWRVFDNLIGNILKYALENTRVYITLKTTPDQAVITFKNVTKYELGEDTEELFERFKRGDASRHTEGSGLGLAIAKSIVDLHENSNLKIDVDGDLFKVTLTLPTIV